VVVTCTDPNSVLVNGTALITYYINTKFVVSCIFQEIGAWIRSNKSSRLEHIERNLRQEFANLQPPPNLNNLCYNTTPTLAGDSFTTQPEIHQMEDIT